LSEQTVEYTISESQTSTSATKGLSRLEKKQRSRQLRAEKQRQKRENPAGFRSSPPRNIIGFKQRRQPKPVATLPQPMLKVPDEKLLASVAKKCETLDEKVYEQLKDPQSDPRVLADEVASGLLVPVLSKYKGFNPPQLMESVITDYIRAERPEAPVAEVEADKPKKPKHTARQLEQIAQTPTPPPMTTVSASNSRKGAAKTVPSKEKYEDSQVALDALELLFQSNSAVKDMLCGVELVEAKRLLRSDEIFEQFVEDLRARLVSPKSVYTHLDTAVRLLTPKYRELQLAAEEEDRQKAEARRREQVALSRSLAESKNAKVVRRQNNTPAYWRGLREA